MLWRLIHRFQRKFYRDCLRACVFCVCVCVCVVMAQSKLAASQRWLFEQAHCNVFFQIFLFLITLLKFLLKVALFCFSIFFFWLKHAGKAILSNGTVLYRWRWLLDFLHGSVRSPWAPDLRQPVAPRFMFIKDLSATGLCFQYLVLPQEENGDPVCPLHCCFSPPWHTDSWKIFVEITNDQTNKSLLLN